MTREAGSDGGPVGEIPTGEPLLEVEGLEMDFRTGGGLLGGSTEVVRAVRGVSFRVRRGETLGLVGESGSGKSTIGRCILGLIDPTGGTVRFDGRDVGAMNREERLAFRKRAQIVFQDPFGTLNPRMRVGAALGEVLRVHGLASGPGVEARVGELLDQVGLRPEHADRYPHEFSGGQRQRVGIARALAVEPEFIVCDEPVSALDVSVQAQILNLLADLQEELGLTYLLIAHDLAVVEHMSDRVAVMYAGRIAEIAPADTLYEFPAHPYTRTLLDAVPRPDPGVRSRAASTRSEKGPPGEVALGEEAAEGCPFYPRCPRPDKDGACLEAVPPLAPLGPEHLSACIKSGLPGGGGSRE